MVGFSLGFTRRFRPGIAPASADWGTLKYRRTFVPLACSNATPQLKRAAMAALFYPSQPLGIRVSTAEYLVRLLSTQFFNSALTCRLKVSVTAALGVLPASGKNQMPIHVLIAS